LLFLAFIYRSPPPFFFKSFSLYVESLIIHILPYVYVTLTYDTAFLMHRVPGHHPLSTTVVPPRSIPRSFVLARAPPAYLVNALGDTSFVARSFELDLPR
jgi:hypothetical protein